MKTEGQCRFCEQTFSKTGILRHLNTHFKAHKTEAEQPEKVTYLVRVTEKYDDTFFLYLLIPANCALHEIDAFLRQTWLECCGHMSSMNPKGQQIMPSDPFDLESEFGLSLEQSVFYTFEQYKELDYEYDFGSTTYLKLTLLQRLELNLSKKQAAEISIVARNEFPEFECSACQKTIGISGFFCQECAYEHDRNPFLCTKCEKKHKCHELGGVMPVSNSPRMGTCAYDGSLDKDKGRKLKVKGINV